MIVEVLALVTFSAFLLFWLARRKNGYWIRRGIAGPQPVPFKGNMDQTFGKSPAVFQLQKWTRQYGKVFGFQDGWFHVLVTSDPEILRELLVDKFEYFHSRLISPAAGDLDHTNEINVFSAKGKRWKRLRAISNPAFSVANLKKVMPTIDDSIQVTMRLLQEASLGSDKAVNMHPYLTEMTLDVIARLALGQQESQQFRSEYCKLAVESFEQFGNSIYDWVSMQFPWLGRNMVHPFLHFVGWMIGDPLSIIQKKVTEVVRERRRQRDNNNKMDQGTGADEEVEDVNARKKPVVDFIDLFLDCISEDYQLSDQSGVFNKLEKFERKLKPEEVVANCIVFMLAGFDTTANSLSIVCNLLALNPEAQERLHEEVDYICPDPEEPPTYEQLSQLKYTEAVVKETLRLYPVASAVVTRVCAETTTLGGYTVEKGTVIKADLLTLHRDKQLWGPDADLFRPERWLDGAEAPPNAYYPFGGGPRICIGMRLAMLEEKMALVHLMRRFRLLKCAETEMEMKLTGQVVLNPRAIHVKLEQRSSMHN